MNVFFYGVVILKDCLVGFYCSNGIYIDRENFCEVGIYSNIIGLESLVECIDCFLGYYCDFENIIEFIG